MLIPTRYFVLFWVLSSTSTPFVLCQNNFGNISCTGSNSDWYTNIVGETPCEYLSPLLLFDILLNLLKARRTPDCGRYAKEIVRGVVSVKAIFCQLTVTEDQVGQMNPNTPPDQCIARVPASALLLLNSIILCHNINICLKTKTNAAATGLLFR